MQPARCAGMFLKQGKKITRMGIRFNDWFWFTRKLAVASEVEVAMISNDVKLVSSVCTCEMMKHCTEQPKFP